MNDYDYNDKEILFLQELRKQYSVLDSYLIALENEIKQTYKDLELKVKNFETDKQKDIDELWETRITPLNKEVKELRADNHNLKSKNRNSDNHIMMLNRLIDFAVGYISATPPHTDKHPMEVKKWLFKGFEGLKE
jgi:predicted RNase H-like nuclease (RuvC/YqgF family)